MPEQQFNTWIRPLQAVEDSGVLRLLAPNRFVVEWVNQNAVGRISELVDSVSDPAPAVGLEVGARRVSSGTLDIRGGVNGLSPHRERSVESQVALGSRLNHEFTFVNFVEGKSNQLARAAAVQVAENP